MNERDELVSVALGERPAGLVLRGGNLVNVYTGEVYRSDVAVAGDRIAAVGDVERCVGDGTRVVEADGRYLVPGFIETHFHVGATSLASTELARLLVPFGTAAIVTDFTEATKLAGVEAARFFLDEATLTPLKVYLSPFFTVLLPSATRRSVTREEFDDMLGWPETLELREWNVQSSRHRSELVREAGRRALDRGLIMAGHLRGQLGPALQASAAAGAASDHEAYTVEEAVERMRAGLAVQIRFGSAHWTETSDLLRAVTQRRLDSRLMMFSTDEEELVDVRDLGFMDHRVRQAIEHGVAPIDAVRMATLNPARFLGVTGDFGGIAPGRKAFVNVVSDLRDFAVERVVYGEQVVAESGRYLASLDRPIYPERFYGSVRLRSPLTADDLAVAAPDGAEAVNARVIGFDPEMSGTKELHLEFKVRDGRVVADPDSDVVKLASVERSAGSGKRGVGFIKGLGMRRGALGFTYHPGPCELALVGADDADMALVANRIAELGGGLVVAAGGSVLAEVPMPLLGLVSDRPLEEVEAGLRGAKRAIAEVLGIAFKSNVYRLAVLFISGVAPELRMTVDGLLRVSLQGARLEETIVPVLLEADSSRAGVGIGSGGA